MEHKPNLLEKAEAELQLFLALSWWKKILYVLSRLLGLAIVAFIIWKIIVPLGKRVIGWIGNMAYFSQ